MVFKIIFLSIFFSIVKNYGQLKIDDFTCFFVNVIILLKFLKIKFWNTKKKVSVKSVVKTYYFYVHFLKIIIIQLIVSYD